MAYAAVFASFETEIAAVAGNPLLTPEQRGAMIAGIRQRQRTAAENASQWEIVAERAAVKERAAWRRRPLPRIRRQAEHMQPSRPETHHHQPQQPHRPAR